jgi:predicted DNA-binding transcriptional regulator AlpA
VDIDLDHDLLDATEVAAVLGLMNWRGVHVYRGRYPDFPKPKVSKGRCLLWLRSDVEAWQRSRSNTDPTR